MKLLLTITILLSCLVGKGQTDTIVPIIDSSSNPIVCQLFAVRKPIYDTIPLVMLVSDTSENRSSMTYLLNGSGSTDSIYFSPSYPFQAIARYGYRVRIKTQDPVTGMSYWVEGRSFYKSIEHLTADKKPIPKGWIVWMAINTN